MHAHTLSLSRSHVRKTHINHNRTVINKVHSGGAKPNHTKNRKYMQSGRERVEDATVETI